MKLMNTLVFTATTALLCVATFHAEAAEAQSAEADARPVLMAQAPVRADAQVRTFDGAKAPAVKGAGERGARLAAAQGHEALRRYVDRTRMIYALDYADFARE